MADLIIDAVQAVGVASATVVSVELTDQRGDSVVGFVTAGNEVIVLPATATTDANGQVTIDLVPNADITPGNTCYTVRIAGKQFLIQKSAVPQGLFDALVTDPGELDPIESNDLQDHINDPTNAHFATAIGFQPYLGLLSDNTQDAIEELYDQAIVGLDDASEVNFAPTGDVTSTNVQDAIVEVDAELHSHESDPTAAHNASAIAVVPFGTIGSTDVQGALEEIMDEIVTTAADTTFVPAGDIVATNVQAAIEEVDAELHAHEADTVDAHDASAISFAPASGITSTNAQDAIVEAKTDSTGYTDAHISDPTAAHAASAVSFSPVNVLDGTDVQSAIAELGESFSTPKTPSGFPNTTDTTIAIVDAGANLTFTIAPVGASFDVWLFGDKHTKTSESVSTPDGLDRVYYFYYDAAGVLSVVTNATQPLGFDWPTQVPVAIAFRNSSGNDLALFDTRHGLSMDWATRGYLHQTRGTQYLSGLVLSGYTLSPGAPVNSDNTWALSSGIIVNEDLPYTIPAVADEGTYTTLYKSGSLPTFTTATSFGTAVPFAVSGSDIAYNLNTAGSYSLAPVPNNEFVNYFIFVTGSQTTGYKTFAFPEETTYASLAAAQAAPITSPFTPGGFAFSEFFMRYRVTYQRSNVYTTTGRCRTVAVTQITNSQTLITSGATPTSHGALTGRDVADQHPASAITFTPAQGIAATNVQSAIEEVVTDTAAGFVPKDGSYAATTTDVVSSRVTADANPRFTVNTDGTQEWGNGTAALDTNLYRSGANVLKTDDSLHVTNQVGIGIAPSASAALTLPTGTTSVQGILFDGDTNLYRSAADTLKTDDRFIPDAGITLNGAVTAPDSVPSLTWGNTTFTGATISGAALMGGSTAATFNYTSGTAGPVLFGWRNIIVLSGTTGGSLAGYDCDMRATNTGTWGGFGELNGNLRGVNALARTVSGFTATGDAAASVIGVRGATAHSAGAGTIGQMYALVAASPLYTAGGTVTNGAAGLRVGNQGNSGYATAYGIRVDGITGSTSLNVGARIDASTERTLWLAGDSNPTTAAGGITFGSSADTNLYRSAANTLKTDDKFVSSASASDTAGAIAAGTFDLAASYSVDPGGTPVPSGLSSTVTKSGAGALAGGFVIGADIIAINAGSGNVANVIVNTATFRNTGAGTVTNASCFQTGIGTITGAVTNLTGVLASATTTTAANTIGVDIRAQAGSVSGIGLKVATASTYTIQLAAATTAAGGITFGTDTNLYRSAANILTTDDKFTTVAGLGVGNSAVATTAVGSLARKIEIFDASGASLGFIPVYSTIT